MITSSLPRLRALALTLFVSTIAPAAFADVLPPDATDCQNKAVGSSCDTNDANHTPGTCQNGTCTSARPCPADAAPGSNCNTSSPCVRCVPGGATGDGGGNGNGTNGDGGSTSTSTSGGGGGGGCAIAGVGIGQLARAAAPVLALGVVPLVLRRRRRAKDAAKDAAKR